MTIGEMRGTIQDLIGPHNGMRPLNAAMIDDLVHKACHSVFHEVLNWRSRGNSTVNVVSGDATYDLPSDYLTMLSVHIADTNGVLTQIRPIPYADRLLDYSLASPGCYYIALGSAAGVAGIVLLPTPTQSITSGLRIQYRRRPAKLSTFAVTDEFTECDTNLHLPICYEAAFLYLNRPGSKVMKDIVAYHSYFNDEVAIEKRRQQEEWQQDLVPVVDFRFGGLE